MRALTVRAVIGLVAVCASAAAVETAPPPRLVDRTPAEEQARAYRALFEKVGRAGLPELTKSKDTSLALQASWELHKKITQRLEKGLNGGHDTYESDEVKKFLTVLKERTKASVPEWWQKSIMSLEVQVYRGRGWSHLVDIQQYHDKKAFQPPGMKEAKLKGWSILIRDGAALTLDGEAFCYKADHLTLQLPKDFLFWPREAVADAISDKVVCLAPYMTCGGFGFTIAGFEPKNSKCLWEAKSWATGRRDIGGPSAGHRVELVVSNDTVFVFGAELWGMYAEGFDLTTGKCRFRFCTSYWGNFSERWDIN